MAAFLPIFAIVQVFMPVLQKYSLLKQNLVHIAEMLVFTGGELFLFTSEMDTSSLYFDSFLNAHLSSLLRLLKSFQKYSHVSLKLVE